MFAAIAVPCASRLRAGFFFALVPASAMPNNANLEVEMLRRGMFRNHRLDRRSGAAAAYASPIHNGFTMAFARQEPVSGDRVSGTLGLGAGLRRASVKRQQFRVWKGGRVV
jgi:hypothetical protein